MGVRGNTHWPLCLVLYTATRLFRSSWNGGGTTKAGVQKIYANGPAVAENVRKLAPILSRWAFGWRSSWRLKWKLHLEADVFVLCKQLQSFVGTDDYLPHDSIAVENDRLRFSSFWRLGVLADWSQILYSFLVISHNYVLMFDCNLYIYVQCIWHWVQFSCILCTWWKLTLGFALGDLVVFLSCHNFDCHFWLNFHGESCDFGVVFSCGIVLSALLLVWLNEDIHLLY